MSQSGASRTRELGVRVAAELGQVSLDVRGDRARPTHAELLEMAARLSGYQHWHEVVAVDTARGAHKADQGDKRLRPPLVVAIPVGSEPGAAALREGVGGVSFNAFDAAAATVLPGILHTLARAAPAAPGWTTQAWSDRAVGLFDALWLALAEGHQAGAWGRGADRLRSAATWEGVSLLRSQADHGLSEAALASLHAWARPWHSSYLGPDDEARNRFKPVEDMWSDVFDWLESKVQSGGPKWGSLRARFPKQLLVEARPRPLALASALLAAEGGELPRVDVSRLESRDVALAVAWFAPSQGDLREPWRSWGKSQG